MKKIFAAAALLAVCLAVTSCGRENSLPEDTSAIEQYIKQTAETMAAAAAAETSTAKITEAAEEYSKNTETSADSDITLEEPAVLKLDEMMSSLIQKDADTWKKYIWYYAEGDSGYLYNVDFEDYEIIDFSVTEKHELYRCKTAVFDVEISVSKSNDIRFPQGRSRWKIMLYGNDLNCCMYFLRDIYSDAGIYLETSENEAAELGYVFSYSFNCFETVNDIREYCFNMDHEAFLDRLKAFVSVADEIIPQIGNEWGDPYYSKDDVNTIISKYLGINDYSWDENFAGLGGDRLWKVWDMKTVYAVITEQTDSYIDMVYFADYVYLTPAKKMRYYFTDNDGALRLIGTELLEDHGYEPNWDCN